MSGHPARTNPGAFPKDARSPEERRESLDPSLDDMLDTLASLVGDGDLREMPALEMTTIAQLWEWGYDVQADYNFEEDDDDAEDGDDRDHDS